MIKFLTKLGQIVLEGGRIVGLFSGAIQQIAPQSTGEIQTVSQDLAQIGDVINEAEIMGQALKVAGPDKLKMAAPAVAQIILKSAMLANHKIANEALFTQGATKIADGMADVINSLDVAGLDAVKKTS